MMYVPFNEYYPEIAEKETRVVTIIGSSQWNLPPDGYAFLEMFCNEAGCDCRRVMFTVIATGENIPVAVIAYGWEKKKFYVKWMGDSDPRFIKELIGPVLNMASQQSQLASRLLELFKSVLMKDAQYIERVKKHYHMVREKVEGLKHNKKMRNISFH
ncbi:MAG: hypothetical protein HQL77_16605 [Magnetococcales bacterium]|nr:hypothetical protein [Magnetococcales bacterium]